jgi:hypothetical protein
MHYVGVIFCLLSTISFKLIAALHFNEFHNGYMAHITIMITIPDAQGLPSAVYMQEVDCHKKKFCKIFAWNVNCNLITYSYVY